MDRLESLGNTLSQITMYDIKSMYNQAKNVVFNVSEMEAKVRDATNDEPWGASSTLMQEIAQGTFNFQNFNEIMPAIYSRFMEKEAKQWRQIYKALQLLEYLVKNGSERVVDDARSHVATIKMLRNFYYTDEKGKDQGLNVRNRARELTELLGDVEKIRTERRKAKANRHKYIGTGNEAMSFSSGGSRYGGFGSDSFGSGSGSYGGGGSYSGRDYDGNGSGSYSGGGSSGFRDEAPRRGYQEYDAGDDETMPRRSNSVSGARSSTSGVTPQRSSTLPTAPPSKAKELEVDLLGMDDDVFGSTTTLSTNKALPAVSSHTALEGDDDFDDFQTAPTSASTNRLSTVAGAAQVPAVLPPSLVQQPAAPLSPPLVQPQAPHQSAALFNMLSGSASASPIPARTSYMSPPPVPVQNLMMQSPAMFAQPAAIPSQPAMMPTQSVLRPTQSFMSPTSPKSASASSGNTSAPKTPASANFDDLWTMSLGSSTSGSGSRASSGAPTAAKSMKDLEKEKTQAGIWGSAQSRPPMGAGFGSFGGAAGTPSAAPASSANAGLDDLLF